MLLVLVFHCSKREQTRKIMWFNSFLWQTATTWVTLTLNCFPPNCQDSDSLISSLTAHPASASLQPHTVCSSPWPILTLDSNLEELRIPQCFSWLFFFHSDSLYDPDHSLLCPANRSPFLLPVLSSKFVLNFSVNLSSLFVLSFVSL